MGVVHLNRRMQQVERPTPTLTLPLPGGGNPAVRHFTGPISFTFVT